MSNGASTDPPLRPRAAAALQRLRGSHGPSQALEAVGEIVSQLIGCEEYALLALNANRTGFSRAAAMGFERERLLSLLSLQGIVGQVCRGGVAYIIGRTSGAGASPQEAGMTACIPLREADRIRGVLVLFRLLPQKRGFDEEDLQMLQILSAHGGVALSEEEGEALLLPAPSAPLPSAAPASEARAIYLHPGDLFASGSPAEVTTLLGSCVAVCLWDSQRNCGGVNHYLLPRAPVGQPPSIRYGDTAIPALIEELKRLGSQPGSLRAKVFGGANMGTAPSGPAPSLGQRNAQLARSLLEELGIPIVAEDLGGDCGRKLRFRTDDGTALVKKLGSG